MDPSILRNLFAIGAQFALVTAIGGALPWLLRLQTPGVLYAYFRTLLAVGLTLPLVQPWRPLVGVNPRVELIPLDTPVGPEAGTAVSAGGGALSLGDGSLATVAIAVLAAGILARLVWMAIGLARLRRLRREGTAAILPDELGDLPRVIGIRADVRWLETLGQPVTFGLRRPVVLLPATLRTLDISQQRTVIAHELFHVQRRDWLWVVVEELLRAVFWFHPAMWWLISRIQLAREQVVDELTVMATSDRRAYMEALLAFADRSPLAPVTAFARRRHLLKRMALISKEVVMSPKRLAVSCAAMAAAIVLTGWYAASAFPLASLGVASDVAEAQTARPAPPPPPPAPPPSEGTVADDGRLPKLIHRVDPVYPAEGRAAAARGHLTMTLTIDAAGNVTEWRVRGMNVSTSKDVDAAAMRDITDAIMRAATDAVQQWRYEPTGRTTVANAMIMIRPPEDGQRTRVTVARQINPPNAVRVGGDVKPPTKIYNVNPSYPPVALQARVQGVVILEVVIDETGGVSDARVLRSIPLLDQAAIDAVTQWKFTPTLLNGRAVPVIMVTTVNFTTDSGAPPPPPPPPPGPFVGQPVSLQFKNAALRDVLHFIGKATGRKVEFDPSVQGTVTVSLSDVRLDQALEIILRGHKLGYTMDDTTIRVAPK